MTNIKRNLISGFTLIEMLLVMVIISIIIYASIGYIMQRAEQARIDRQSLQMQQILNAGLAYYIDHGQWPAGPNLTNLQGIYLPPATVPFRNPWGNAYTIYSYPITSSNPKLFYVWAPVTATTATSGSAAAAAQAIAGLLPMGYSTPNAPGGGGTPPAAGTCTAATLTCYVVAMVNIPGQNINNARAMNFAGLYHHGGCVPVPECPVDVTNTQMTPEIMVVPVSVSGVYNANDNTSVYPISSFTAYAKGPGATGANPTNCWNNANSDPCTPLQTSTAASKYWRVCLQVVTEQGDVASHRAADSTVWGQAVTLAAFTRCSVQNEAAGSSFSVYSK